MPFNTLRSPDGPSAGLMLDPCPRPGIVEAQYVMATDTGRSPSYRTALRLEFTEQLVSEAARDDILRYAAQRMASELPSLPRPRLSLVD